MLYRYMLGAYVSIKHYLLLNIGIPLVNYLLFNFVPINLLVNSNTLIVKLDAIGDFIIFEPYLKILLESLGGHSVTLLGNEAWKDLVKDYYTPDSKLKFVFVNRFKLKYNLLYRFKIGCALRKQAFNTVIHPTFHRDYYVDCFLNSMKASNLIGSKSTTWNSTEKLLAKSDLFYCKLSPTLLDNSHEVLRYKLFFEKLLNRSINPLSYENILSKNQKNYICIFPGASTKNKRWPTISFAQLIDSLPTNLEIMLLGGKGDITLGYEILNSLKFKRNILNQIGKTNLTELNEIISKAKLLITNDTSALHFGVASNIPILCFHNGYQAGLFVPYPAFNPDKFKLLQPLSYLKALNEEGIEANTLEYDMAEISVSSANEAIILLISVNA